MSTAAAPVSDRSAAFTARAATTFSTPARPPLTTRRLPNATLAISSSFSAKPASQRASPASTSVATTTSPDFNVGSSPPATPKLITPLIVDGSKTVSSARNCCGSLLLQMTVMPGPAAMQVSCTIPVTINTGRGSIGLPADASSPAPKFTFRPLPPCCWCSSNSDTAPTPRAERTSDTHDSADKTPEESLLPCSAARPTSLFGSVLLLGTPRHARPRDARPRPLPSVQARPTPFARRSWGHPRNPYSRVGNWWHPRPSRRPCSGSTPASPLPCRSPGPGDPPRRHSARTVPTRYRKCSSAPSVHTTIPPRAG